MKLILYIVLAFSLVAILTFAESPVSESQGVAAQRPYGEYRYEGNWIVCVVSDSWWPDSLAELACLHIGEFTLGDSMSMWADRLDKPYDSWSDELGSQFDVYLLPFEGKQDIPYLLFEHRSGQIVALQMSGPATTDTTSFAGLHLGDPVEILQKKLGPPSSTREVADIKGELWSYQPFPISVEVVNKRISSIRIYLSDEMQQALGIK